MAVDVIVTPQPWLWAPRYRPIRFIEIHATRGNTTPDKQFGATINWMESPGNIGGRQSDGSPAWGSSCSKILGRQGEVGFVLRDNQMPTFSAGYGNYGFPYGFSIDEYGISWEWCQSDQQEDFTDFQYKRGAKEIAKECVTNNIPAGFITVNPQSGNVPTGLVRHDRCENGAKLGKTDPGGKFSESYFLVLLREEIAILKSQGGSEVPITNDEWTKIEELIESKKPQVFVKEGSGAQEIVLGSFRIHITNQSIRTEMIKLGMIRNNKPVTLPADHVVFTLPRFTIGNVKDLFDMLNVYKQGNLGGTGSGGVSLEDVRSEIANTTLKPAS